MADMLQNRFSSKLFNELAWGEIFSHILKPSLVKFKWEVKDKTLPFLHLFCKFIWTKKPPLIMRFIQTLNLFSGSQMESVSHLIWKLSLTFFFYNIIRGRWAQISPPAHVP